MDLSRRTKQILSKEYHDVELSGSYQSPGKFYTEVIKRHPQLKITLRQVQDWIKGEDTYTLNKEVCTKFLKSVVVVDGISDIWEADLADMSKYSSMNGGYRYLLGVIDIFSRKLYVTPLENKYAETVIKGFDEVIRQAGTQCRKLRSDMGSEFTNEKFRLHLQKLGIGHYYSHGTAQCPYIERVWKTLKKRIVKYMTQNSTKEYISRLSHFVESYNNTTHSIIQMAPNQVTKENESEVRYNQYVSREKRGMMRGKYSKIKYRFKLGENVRIAKRKEKISSEYKERWSRETYQVVKRKNVYGIPMYEIADVQGEVLSGGFYEGELQSVMEDHKDKLYQIDKIFKRRVVKGVPEVFVSWKGYNKKFNTWIPASAVEDISGIGKDV